MAVLKSQVVADDNEVMGYATVAEHIEVLHFSKVSVRGVRFGNMRRGWWSEAD